MSGASESLARKIGGAQDLSAVVRSMKALAASSVGQYERAVESLHDYTRTVEFSLSVCLREISRPPVTTPARNTRAGVILFGSDQGLVGRFNEILLEFFLQELKTLPTKVACVWAVGARLEQLLFDVTLPAPVRLAMPHSVEAITPLVGELLLNIEQARDSGSVDEVYLVHNRPLAANGYRPVLTRLLPLDAQWQTGLAALPWPTKARPQVIDGPASALPALLRSYFFVVLFQVCAQSLASENASRLAAMQRAQENIAAMLVEFTGQFRRMRQASIDEELFEVVSGYDALSLRR